MLQRNEILFMAPEVQDHASATNIQASNNFDKLFYCRAGDPMLSKLTSELARPGHPDKLADQVSDAILDAHLFVDPLARVAVECLLKGNTCTLAGEITSRSEIDLQSVVASVLGKGMHVTTHITRQDRQIAGPVDRGGAGDMGHIFGYAHREKLPIQQCREIVSELERIEGLLPDGKVQVTGAQGPIVICVQHLPGFDLKMVRNVALPNRPLLLRGFISGGIAEDAGVTGRKTASDTYGGACPHGGGGFSGKDPTKVDRSAAYAARFVAKHLLQATGATSVEVQVAYALGLAEPVSIRLIVDGKHQRQAPYFDWRPLAIIERFDLRKPIYLDLARNGHFFREHLPWEQTR